MLLRKERINTVLNNWLPPRPSDNFEQEYESASLMHPLDASDLSEAKSGVVD